MIKIVGSILLATTLLIGCGPSKEEMRWQAYLSSLSPEQRVMEKQIRALFPYDPIKRDYVRSLSPDKRTEIINQIIVAREQPSPKVNVTYEAPTTIPQGAAAGFAEGMR